MDYKASDFLEYNLFKMGVLDDNSLSSVASKNVGIHSARISSPYVLCASRNSNFLPKEMYNQLYIIKNLIKLRCMRTTLHIVNINDAPYFHVATKDLRLKIEQTKLKKLNINKQMVDKLKQQLLEFCNRPLQPAQIFSNLHIKGLTLKQSNALLKYLWEDGFLCYVNLAKDWQKEVKAYAITSRFYNGLNLNSVSKEQALNFLFTLYLKQFGPVTVKDASWWSGISQSTILNVWNKNDVKTFNIDGQTFYMLNSDYNNFLKFSCSKEYVKLLAYEDSALKGYFTSRNRYQDLKLQSLIFNTIGEVMPVIVSNGKIVGKWWWNKKTALPEYQLFAQINKRQTKLLDAQLKSFATRLGGKNINLVE